MKKAFLKENPAEIGEILDVYTTEQGQKRLVVSFPNHKVDAEISTFEILGVK